MKQIPKTDDIVGKIRASVGSEVNVDDLAVFESIAFNTLPVRKQHPVYVGAVADRSLLYEMAMFVNKESVPIHVQHIDDGAPVGRVFHASVVDTGVNSELRTLMFIDAKNDNELVSKIDNGVLDQVSVSFLSKHAYSPSGFDFLGDDAEFEHIVTGTDPDGNKMGKNGAHARLVGLKSFYEVSLVGQGGAQNARIVANDQAVLGSKLSRLVASGLDPSILVLTATVATKEDSMDLAPLVAELTAKAVELSQKDAEIVRLKADLTSAQTELATARQAADPTELNQTKEQLTAANAEKDAALTALKNVATTVLTAAGKPTEKVPDAVDDIVNLISETSTALVAALAGSGKSKGADAEGDKPMAYASDAFRIRS
jgi:hypothetical protein